MNVRKSRSRRSLGRLLLIAAASAMLTAGCATLVGRPAKPLDLKRDQPGVDLCLSERAGGGIRLLGRMNVGVYPVTRVTLQYKTAEPQDAVPATDVGGRLELSGPRSEKVDYRSGAKEVTYTIGADAARSLRGKVLWYRWIVESQGGVEASAIHRTSLEEAGLPRAPYNPGPDASVAPGTTRRR
jgi:hypothetical protein